MNMHFIDTHAHLYSQDYTEDIADVIERCVSNGIKKIYMPNIDSSTIEPMLAIELKYPAQCFAMIGIHPCHIMDDYIEQLNHMEGWLKKRQFAAIGEVGMDLYREKKYMAQQEEAFKIQLEWAKKYNLPVVIHCRESFEQLINILEDHQDGSLKGIFHCFGGSLEEANRIIKLGFYLGIGGVLTFKNVGLYNVLMNVDLEHIVLETDAPYLAPVPYRGKRNEPAYLLHTAEKLAFIKGISLEKVASITTTNAEAIFGC